MSHPRITVYIPSHNYGRFLQNATDSVLRQTVDDWELLIIDDASVDNTREIMRIYEQHPQIRTFYTDGIGLPAVCNLALREAHGDYIIRLDADDVFDDNILLILGNYLDINPECALVFPDYYLVNDFGEIFAHEKRMQVSKENHMLDMPPNGACTLIRKNILESLGGYREDLGAQDGFDLWTRVRDQFKTANINLPLFYYRRHGKNLTSSTSRILAARQQIKKDAVYDKLDNNRPVIAVIPCRRNYDFMPDLWNQKLGSNSLLEMGVSVCLASSVIDHVVVACDNEEAKDVLDTFDDNRLSFYLRDPKSTIRTESIVPTLKGIADTYDPQYQGIMIQRYLQTPFVTTDTLEEAITTLVMNDADSAHGVEQIRSEVFKRVPHGLEVLNKKSLIYSDFDMLFRDTNTFTASYSRNLKRGSIDGASIVSFEVSAAEPFFINSDHDFHIAQMIASKNE